MLAGAAQSITVLETYLFSLKSGSENFADGQLLPDFYILEIHLSWVFF